MDKVRLEVEKVAWATQELERRRKPKPREQLFLIVEYTAF